MSYKIEAVRGENVNKIELYIDDELIKEFDISPEEGKETHVFVNYFYFKLKGAKKKEKYDVLIETTKRVPRVFIYPMYGDGVLTANPIDVVEKK